MKEQVMYAVYERANHYFDDRLIRCFTTKELAERYKENYLKLVRLLSVSGVNYTSGEIEISDISLNGVYDNTLKSREEFEDDIFGEIYKHEDLYMVNSKIVDSDFEISVASTLEDMEKFLVNNFKRRFEYSCRYGGDLSVFKMKTSNIDKVEVSALVVLDVFYKRISLVSLESKENFNGVRVTRDAVGKLITVCTIIDNFTSIEDAVKTISSRYREETGICLF